MNDAAMRELDELCAAAHEANVRPLEAEVLGLVCDDCWTHMPIANPGCVPGHARADMQMVVTRCGHHWQIPVKGFPTQRIWA